MAREGQRPVLGVYHVATFPGWRAVAGAQCRRLGESGLLARTARLLVGVVGDPAEDLSPLADALGGRAEVRHLGPLSAYEIPTLGWLHDEARSGEAACWYLHTKGVSSMSEGAADHRLGMEAVVLDNHEACLGALDEYDACGAEWRVDGFGARNPHFPGNFWWANARYLRGLPPPSTLDLGDRYQAEFWVGKGPAIRAIALAPRSDPFARPTAWSGLESRYGGLLGDIGPVRRVVDLGVDYGFTTFHFARDYPGAEVVGVDDFSLHEDAEGWVRGHLPPFPNVRLVKGRTAGAGRAFTGPVDLLHIDADHSFAAVAEDFGSWLHAVRPGGRVLFHDTVTFPAVGRFFRGLEGAKGEILEHNGLGCWVRP